MFDELRTRLLRLMRVPPDPHPPTGAPGSVRVFRAGRNLYKLRLLRWGLGQAGALAGIVISLSFLSRLEREITQALADSPPAASARPAAPPANSPSVSPDQPPTSAPKPASTATKRRPKASVPQSFQRWPRWVFGILNFLEWTGVALYVIQIPVTHALVRLEYELRWYIVTDRSLRIRAGLATVKESTMSFANLQQVVVTQGPLQRVLGIADVRVQSAGGGAEAHGPQAGDSLHTGVFHGVDNAHEIRDLVLERLRRFRESGLGDPDEPTASAFGSAPISSPGDVLAAARQLVAEARALRQIV